MARRDSRADILDEDPFRKQKPRIHRVHARQAQDGTIHFETGASAKMNPLFAQMMGLAPQQPAKMHKGSIWHFSSEEKKTPPSRNRCFYSSFGFYGRWRDMGRWEFRIEYMVHPIFVIYACSSVSSRACFSFA